MNVSASRLSLFSERPDDFELWLDRDGRIAADPAATLPDGRRYPQRGLYGAYVADTLRQVASAAVAGSCRHVRSRATGARRRPGGGYRVRLSDDAAIEADLLLLATGHPAPQTPAFLGDVPREALVADPWAPDALAAVAADHEILVVGTGLTACDIVASLRARGHRGRITAVSRRGLLPRPRTTKPVAAFGDFDTRPAETAIGLLRAVRAAVGEATASGRPWEDVIDALRTQAGTVWNALSLAERRRLLRHLRPFWDVHRFQSAPQVARAIADAEAEDRLRVRAAAVVSVTPSNGRLRAVLRPRERRGEAAETAVVVDRVIDCTGPGHRTLVDTNPFLADLAEAGLLRADDTRLGLSTDRLSRAIDWGGRAAPDLFVLGPPARAAHGELMGLPQVSAQPRDVARAVASLLGDAYAGAARSGGRATRTPS